VNTLRPFFKLQPPVAFALSPPITHTHTHHASHTMAGKQPPTTSSYLSSPIPSPRDAHTTTALLLDSHANSSLTDDIRRSGRANKGHHTKNQDLFDEPQPPTKSKSKGKGDKKAKSQSARSESTQSGAQQDAEPDDEEEEEAIIRCVCGDQRDIRGRQMICCDNCSAWQHVKCLGLQEGEHWNEDSTTYFCEQCKPADHVDLLAAMARGEKPWNRKKGSKAAKLKSRPSDVHSETAPETPVKPEKAEKLEKAEKPEKPEKPQKLEVPKVPTPQATTPVQAPAPAPVPVSVPAPPAPTPAPVETAKEVPLETSNGHQEPKVGIVLSNCTNNADLSTQKTNKETPKSQPHSPLGEKRGQDAIVEKETSKPKRRKSSTHAAAQPVQPVTAKDPSTLPDKQRLLVVRVVETLSTMIKQASDAGKYRIPDGATPSSIATRLALEINHAAINHHGEPTDNASPYVLQFRSIIFNAKKNSIIVDRLLSGSLDAEELAIMSAEEMASEEKQQEYAAMREANEKQMVLTEVAGPRLRKTHKGEEIVEPEENIADHEFRPPERRDRENEEEARPMDPPSPHRDEQTTVELPEDIGQRAPLSVDTSGTPTDSTRRPSTSFDINSVFSQVKSPHKDQATFIQRRQSSIRVHDKPQEGPGDDADIDRLLKDEDNDVEMTGYSADPTIVWQGTLDMQTMGPFDAAARFVAGGDFGQVVPWTELLSSKLPIQGRIESQRGNEYIQGLATSETHDIGVLSISPITPEGRIVMDHLYKYFHPRDRWGVVPVEKLGNETMRDLYVIPIEPGGSNLPPFLDMLEYCTIETPRKEYMILLALVAKLPDVRPQLPPTQHFERYPASDISAGQVAHSTPTPQGNGPNGPNPHGPQYSPMTSNFSPAQYGNQFAPPNQLQYGHLQHQYNNGSPPQAQNQHQQAPIHNGPPQHHQIPRALDILQGFIDAPVVVQLLGAEPPPTEDQLMNIRHIVERVPEARTSLDVFVEEMTRKVQNGGDTQMQG
jgi:hypothetical protein